MTIGRFWAAFGLTLGLLVSVYSAQNSTSTKLARDHFRSGEEILRAFAPVSEKVRHSIVRFNVDGEIVCLGAIIDTNGLALTKASRELCSAPIREVHVGEDDVDLLAVRRRHLQRLARGRRIEHAIAVRRQHAMRRQAHSRLIVDHEHGPA